MSYVKIMVHSLWSTKNRVPLIGESLKGELLNHIRENAVKKNIFIDTVNCIPDHIHLLISLGSEQTISKVIQLIKGESSHWINEQNIIRHKFEWQDDYFAVSVSQSMIEQVRTYIRNQEEHHRKKTFAEEYAEFINKYGFKL